MSNLENQSFQSIFGLSAASEPSLGSLKICVTSSLGLLPVKGAAVRIAFTGMPESPTTTLMTDESGQTKVISLPAPNVSLSLSPDQPQPYSEVTVAVQAPDYEDALISGVQILPGELAVLPVRLRPLFLPNSSGEELYVIPAHTLFSDDPPKFPEAEIKPLPDTGEIVLSRVVIPEYIIVHDGAPEDSSAPNYYVRYKDYVKNVAACEIYSTWPEQAILANVLAIESFTLNRVYTEWYRSKGYDFTITSSTAYDQKWVNGRNTYENIDRLVDTIFANYLSRPGVRQPIFTSYCDGNQTTCGGLNQWGSRYLADEGYSAIEILRRYYGNDLYVNTAQQISGVPSSYPGYSLQNGSTGEKVRQLQSQLNRISQNYPAIPKLVEDGIYGPATAQSVRVFQRVFGLPETGVTDFATWYKISEIYVGITRISEPGAY
ncbi:MAG: peptidoglycan-binding protein [Lachnospiraceae bacterium]|nr:peptidoglycan-binding protein [Lachnospiraceae bacterium]